MGKELVRRKMIRYEPMQQSHVAAIAQLERECFSMPWSENAIASELQNPLSLWIVALDGEKVVGYVGSQSVMGEADMMNIAVRESHRRQGVAQGLLDALESALRMAQVHSVTLEVRASNEPAKALYERAGYQQVGCRPNYYSAPKEDALILRKEWEL